MKETIIFILVVILIGLTAMLVSRQKNHEQYPKMLSCDLKSINGYPTAIISKLHESGTEEHKMYVFDNGAWAELVNPPKSL